MACDGACDYFTSIAKVPDKVEFWGRVDQLLYGEDKTGDGFCAYMQKYIDVHKPTLSVSTVKTYTSVLNFIKTFEKHIGKELSFADINQDFYERLQNYTYHLTHGKTDPVTYSNNYFGRIVKFVKCIYNYGRIQGAHTLPVLSDFKVENRTADTIYLTTDELMRMYAVPLKHEGEIVARAKFLVGAFTGLRVSDYNNLNELNISDKFITVFNKKTGKKTIAPINSVVKDILTTVDIFKSVTDPFINRTVKDVARAAGITQQVEITKYIGGKRLVQSFEKCDLVTSHTARRSFATNAYKAGVPTLAIMKITGHSTEKSFLKYIKISEEENAQMLAEHEFFR